MSFPNYNFEIGNKILTLSEIKRGLISRDLSKQICAVEALLSRLISADNEFINAIINADVVELLCETSCTTNTFLLQLIFRCFARFIETNHFFRSHHTVHTLESLFRTLHILSRTDKEKEGIISGLQLVCEIISRLKVCNLSLRSVCDIANLLNLCISLFKFESNNIVICTAAEVILHILHFDDVIQIKELILEALLVSLISLSCTIKRDGHALVVPLIIELINGSMRFFKKANVNFRSSDILEDSTYLEKELLDELHVCVKGILAPFIINETRNSPEIHCDFALIKSILSSIINIYYFSDEKLTEELSKFLVSEGFLIFLPNLECQCNERELVIIIRSIICELLVCLSQQQLGPEKWHQLLIPGLEALPIGNDCNRIPIFGSRSFVPLASIVYKYFQHLATRSPTTDIDFYEGLCKYILLLAEQPTSPVIKASWFVFCIAYLSNGENIPEAKIAQRKIISLVLNCSLNCVITYHPAILYWAFSNHSVPCELRTQIISLWLGKGDSTSFSTIASLMKINNDSLILTMELMSECGCETSQFIDSVINSILPAYKNKEEIFQYAWSVLPKLLAKYTSNPRAGKYEGIAYLMKYCSLCMPKTLDYSTVMRISCLLPSTFSKYFLSAFYNRKKSIKLSGSEIMASISTFKLVHILLQREIEINDRRVSTAFLGHDEFIASIQFFTDVENNNLLTVIIQLLTVFIICKKKFGHWCSKEILLDGTKILKFLQGEHELSIAVLKFLTTYFDSLNDSEDSIINIPQPTGLQLRSLYLQIHMICAKCDDMTIRRCWLCLRKLLEFSNSMGLKEHFAALPYTPILLAKTIAGETRDEAFEFLQVWIKTIKLYSPKSHSPTLAHEVIQKLTKKINKVENGLQLVETINNILDPDRAREKTDGSQIQIVIKSQK